MTQEPLGVTSPASYPKGTFSTSVPSDISASTVRPAGSKASPWMYRVLSGGVAILSLTTSGVSAGTDRQAAHRIRQSSSASRRLIFLFSLF